MASSKKRAPEPIALSKGSHVIDKLRVARVMKNKLGAQRVYQAYPAVLLFCTKTLLPL